MKLAAVSKTKIALPRTEMSAAELIALLEAAVWGDNQTAIRARKKLHALTKEIDTNRRKLLGIHHAN